MLRLGCNDDDGDVEWALTMWPVTWLHLLLLASLLRCWLSPPLFQLPMKWQVFSCWNICKRWIAVTELPLVLYDCDFGEELEWVFEADWHEDNIRHLQQLWAQHAIKYVVTTFSVQMMMICYILKQHRSKNCFNHFAFFFSLTSLIIIPKRGF